MTVHPLAQPLPRPLLVLARLTALAGAMLLGAIFAVSTASPAPAASATTMTTAPPDPDPRWQAWRWPLDPAPAIRAHFDPPDEEWSAGHRGIDVAGQVGQAVLAVDDGVVTYAGQLAGRGVVVVSHGRLHSTYEPVTAAVSRGDHVAAGRPIGVLQGVGSHCLPAACLHLGARVGDGYLDPEDLLGSAEIRLKPWAGLATESGVAPEVPVAGRGWVAAVGRDVPITSGFGSRAHPLTGQSSFHDGVDYGVGCGTPIAAAAAGTVVRAGADPIYGHQIIVEHRDGMESRYGHMYADGVLVRVGEQVRARQVIGTVGSDGWSTGCHLHFTVASHGRPVDPMAYVPR